MRPYPLRKGITREAFNTLVIDLCDRLAAKGINPGSNLSVAEKEEISGDGKIHPRFALFITEAAAQILEHKPNGKRRAEARYFEP
jgi:hypothetical protein